MNIRFLLSWGQEKLSRSALHSARSTAALDSEALLAFVLHRERVFLYAHPDAEVTLVQEKRYRALISRRFSGIPLAYLTGVKEFFGHEFLVNTSVLIPRPDTEILVERILAYARTSYPNILELGTGSGCIAISLKLSLPCASLVATDVSQKALAVARKNARRHHVHISFLQSNLFSHPFFKKTSLRFDIILFNPPYLTKKEASKKSLRFEPRISLTPPSSARNFFVMFLSQATQRLTVHGRIFVELGHRHAPVIEKILKNNFPAFQSRFHKDLGGFFRVAEIFKK